MKKEDWLQNKWRPSIAWLYMAVCAFDFIIGPIFFTIVQFWETSVANDAFRQWAPMTLQGGGLFHISMCAVLGVSAHGRTQEKLAITNAGPIIAPVPITIGNAGAIIPPAPTTVAYAAPVAAPMVGVVNGKPAPPKQIDPIL
jgi:hypothetical protein